MGLSGEVSEGAAWFLASRAGSCSCTCCWRSSGKGAAEDAHTWKGVEGSGAPRAFFGLVIAPWRRAVHCTDLFFPLLPSSVYFRNWFLTLFFSLSFFLSHACSCMEDLCFQGDGHRELKPSTGWASLADLLSDPEQLVQPLPWLFCHFRQCYPWDLHMGEEFELQRFVLRGAAVLLKILKSIYDTKQGKVPSSAPGTEKFHTLVQAGKGFAEQESC